MSKPFCKVELVQKAAYLFLKLQIAELEVTKSDLEVKVTELDRQLKSTQDELKSTVEKLTEATEENEKTVKNYKDQLEKKEELQEDLQKKVEVSSFSDFIYSMHLYAFAIFPGTLNLFITIPICAFHAR